MRSEALSYPVVYRWVKKSNKNSSSHNMIVFPFLLTIPINLFALKFQVSGLFYGIIYNLIDPGLVKTKTEEMQTHLQFMEEQLQDKYFAGQW